MDIQRLAVWEFKQRDSRDIKENYHTSIVCGIFPVVRLLTGSIIDNNRIASNRIFTSVYDIAFGILKMSLWPYFVPFFQCTALGCLFTPS